MVRYKRYKRSYSGTRCIKMRFQSFMDVNTTNESMQVITISAGGEEVLRRLAPQFSAYKYYKLGSVSVKLVPASTLPVDPTGLSYEAGEPGVDPRDQLTPGLMRITNGEDIFENIAGLSDLEQHDIYNNMLLDPRWFKWMLQSGVKRYATPRFWQIGQLHQDKWPGAFLNVPSVDADKNLTGTSTIKTVAGPNGVAQNVGAGQSSIYGFFQTGHAGRLGWMPTDGLIAGYGGQLNPTAVLASPPEVEVMKIILPKAYKTKYFYRMFITETVYFKAPIVNFGIQYQNISLSPLDVFHHPSVPVPALPDEGYAMQLTDDKTGGNYGDD